MRGAPYRPQLARPCGPRGRHPGTALRQGTGKWAAPTPGPLQSTGKVTSEVVQGRRGPGRRPGARASALQGGLDAGNGVQGPWRPPQPLQMQPSRRRACTGAAGPLAPTPRPPSPLHAARRSVRPRYAQILFQCGGSGDGREGQKCRRRAQPARPGLHHCGCATRV